MPLDAGKLSFEEAGALIASWGFLALRGALPDKPGQSHLVLAFREHPEETHYDPEQATYWRGIAGRGESWAIARHERPFAARPFAWGEVRVRDRFGVANAWVTFGGSLELGYLGGTARLAVFRSDAPILRAGGHSQAIDDLAPEVLVFFARLRARLYTDPHLEAEFTMAPPFAVEAAFLDYALRRYGTHLVAALEPERLVLLRAEAARVARVDPAAWAYGVALVGRTDL